MSRSLVEAEAVLQGYNKKWVWLRLSIGGANRILTMPRDFLPWGYATASRVVLEYDPESFHHDGHGYTLEGQIVRKLDDREET